MLAAIDLNGFEADSKDCLLLQAFLQQLVGQPLLAVRFSYGDELNLHFGRPQPHRSPKMAHLVRGQYILGARASRWQMLSATTAKLIRMPVNGSGPLADEWRPLTPQQVEQGDFIPSGTRVAAAESLALDSESIGLMLAFMDGSVLSIIPARSTDEVGVAEVADWELFTPHARWLRVGPGARWSCLPSRADEMSS